MTSTDLWMRFDQPEGFQPREHTDKHHLITSDLDECKFGEVNLACVSPLVIIHANLRHLAEASRTVEHRKKCPACYDYWMARRRNRQAERAQGAG